MDMSAGFAAATRAAAPHVKIVHDKFHVSKLLNEAVDRVRRGEVKEDDRLKGSRQLWLYNPMNLEDERLDVLEGGLAAQNSRAPPGPGCRRKTSAAFGPCQIAPPAKIT